MKGATLAHHYITRTQGSSYRADIAGGDFRGLTSPASADVVAP
jgi:hypothetical protein